MYLETLKFKDETNWGNEVLCLRKKYNLPLKDDNIKNMSERDWKSVVKSSVYREAFLQLQVELSMNRKTSRLSYNKLSTKDYLKQLPPICSIAKVVFRAKTSLRMLDIKTNYKNKYYENLKCPFAVCLMNHLTTFSPADMGLEFPRKLDTSGYSPLGQKFHCQFLKRLGSFLRDT